MKLFSTLRGRRRRLVPLKVPGYRGLEVIPYVRGRLVFAHLAAQALSRGAYDLVLVDLPVFMNDPQWLAHPLGLMPLVSLAIFQRKDKDLRAIAFGPHDAATLGVYLAQRQGVPYRCVDDSDLLHYPAGAIFAPELPVRDDYRVFSHGLKGFFEPLWAGMEKAWEEAGEDLRFFTRYRAQEVANRLREAWTGSGRALFLCDYQLWWALRRTLASPPQEKIKYIFRWRQSPGVLRVEDPYFAWVQGLLDDYPALNLEFWNLVQTGQAASFDKLEAFEARLKRTLTSTPMQAARPPAAENVIFLKKYLKDFPGKDDWEEDDEDGDGAEEQLAVSVRSLISFLHYLKKLTVIHKRLVPEPGGQFFHATQACGGKALHRAMARAFLEYPARLTGQQIKMILKSSGAVIMGGPGLLLPGYEGLPSFFTGRPFSPVLEGASWMETDAEQQARQATCDLIHQEMTFDEREELERIPDTTHTRWEVKDDYCQHARASAYVRHLAQVRLRQFVPRRSFGPVEAGIHWKATLAAMAKGEQGIYVKHRTYSESLRLGIDEYTPVALLLAPPEEIDRGTSFCVHDSNLSQRNRELGNADFPYDQHPEEDMVYSVFATTNATRYYLDGHVHQEDLTSLAFLYTKELMGVARYTAINRHRPGYQCRLTPSADSQLRVFPLSERGVAWAVKYADHLVLVGAPYRWQPSARLQAFARERRIKIVSVNLASLRPDFLERLGRVFLLSTPLKKHPLREEIVRRFIY